jgi:hypothetical protein
MEETNWFPPQIKPVHEGVYKTEHTIKGQVFFGFSKFEKGLWSYREPTIEKAAHSRPSYVALQHKWWKGLTTNEAEKNAQTENERDAGNGTGNNRTDR